MTADARPGRRPDADNAALTAACGSTSRACRDRSTRTDRRRRERTSSPAIYERATADGAAHDVLLNFAEVDYINSTGIALIVGLLGRARAEGRTLAACGLSDHYREIFEITRLSDFIALYPDETSAPAGHEEERT